jgi:hypothetical protein
VLIEFYRRNVYNVGGRLRQLASQRNWNMGRARWAICALAALAYLWPGPPVSQAAEKDDADEAATFEMKEVSLLDAKDEEAVKHAVTACIAYCSIKPDEKVKAYPALKSKRPLYGTLAVDGNRFRGERGTEYHFVLDASGEPAKAEPKSFWDTLVSALTGKKAETTENYDLLYFDANCDLDLTDDPVVKLMKKPRPLAFASEAGGSEQEPVFDCISLPVDYGPGVGTRPMQLVPVLTEVAPEFGEVEFVPTVVRRGTIRFGKTEFTAMLSHACTTTMTGRFDRPLTGFRLEPVDAAFDRARWSSWSIYRGEMRSLDDQPYTISTTPTGDKLFVKPYRGDFGVLEVGPGDRKITKFGLAGTVYSDNYALTAISERKDEKPGEYHLPVGDYRVDNLNIDFGRLSIFARCADSPRYYPDQYGQRPATFPIKIRKDKPCVLDFSTKPTVAFVTPSGNQTFKPGDTVKLEAFLVDPELGVVFGGLNDTTKKVGEYKYKDEKGNEIAMPRYASLDPTVEITDSSGKKVADGIMPFG